MTFSERNRDDSRLKVKPFPKYVSNVHKEGIESRRRYQFASSKHKSQYFLQLLKLWIWYAYAMSGRLQYIFEKGQRIPSPKLIEYHAKERESGIDFQVSSKDFKVFGMQRSSFRTLVVNVFIFCCLILSQDFRKFSTSSCSSVVNQKTCR